jgi:putative transposase
MHAPLPLDLLKITLRTIQQRPMITGTIAREVIQSLYRVQCFNPFDLYAFVVMPDHCHALVGGRSYGSMVKIINKWKESTHHECGSNMWQARFEIQIVSPSERIVEHLLLNPVRRGIAVTKEEYPWSSACARWDVKPLPRRTESPLLQRIGVFNMINHSALPGRVFRKSKNPGHETTKKSISENSKHF